MMKPLTVALLSTFLASSLPSRAAPPLKALDLLGKTFEECETVLGKPVRQKDPEGDEKAFLRDYKMASIPNLTRLQLFRGPDGAADRPVSQTVNGVIYHFAKGSVKTWQDAFKLAGLKVEGAKPAAALPNGIQQIEPAGVPAGYVKVQWTPSASTMSMPEKYRRPNEDSLEITGKLPQFKPAPSPAPAKAK